MRAFAGAAFLPPVVVFPLWALAAWHGTRGPAGAVAGLVLMLVPAICLILGFPVLRGGAPAWGWRTKAAVALDVLLLAGFLFLRPLLIPRYNARGEAETRRALAAFRTALQAYQGARGAYPERPSLLVPGLLPALPRLHLPGTGHPITREVRFPASNEPPDSGKWYYVDEPGHHSFGAVAVDCTHTDSRGTRWSDY